jgi:hypothetical protein
MNELQFEVTSKFAEQIVSDMYQNPHEWIFEDKSYEVPGTKDFYRYSKDHHLSIYYQPDGKMSIAIFSNDGDYGSALEEKGAYIASEHEQKMIDAAIKENMHKFPDIHDNPLNMYVMSEDELKNTMQDIKENPNKYKVLHGEIKTNTNSKKNKMGWGYISIILFGAAIITLVLLSKMV